MGAFLWAQVMVFQAGYCGELETELLRRSCVGGGSVSKASMSGQPLHPGEFRMSATG